MEGGGYFRPSTEGLSRKYDVLGSYESLPDSPAAVVKCHVGSGKAVLSGVHLEFNAHCLDKFDSDLAKHIPAFLESDILRQKVFEDMLMEVGLYTRTMKSHL